MRKKDRRKFRELPTPFPVSAEATHVAFDRIIGGKSTDPAKYLAFQQHLEKHQPTFFKLMPISATFKEHLLPSSSFATNSYMGGVLLYFASVEEQARMQGADLLKISDEAIRGSSTRDLVAVAGTQAVLDITTMFENHLPTKSGTDAMSRASSVEELNRKIEVNRPLYKDMIVTSPFAAQNIETFGSVEPIAKAAIAYRIGQFATTDQAFITTMNDLWWKDIDAGPAACQLMGAADTQAAIAYQYEIV